MSPILVGFDLLHLAAEESLSLFTYRLFDIIRRWDGELEAHVTAEALDAAFKQLSEKLDHKSVERYMVRWRQALVFPADYPQHLILPEIERSEADVRTTELWQAQRQGMPIVCFNQEQYKHQAAQDCIEADIWSINELDQWCELQYYVGQLKQFIHPDPQLIARYLLFLPGPPFVPEEKVFIVTDVESLSEADASNDTSPDSAEQPLRTNQDQKQSNGHSEQHSDPNLPVHGRGTQISKMQMLPDSPNPGADGLHILLFLFSQYLLMQLLQNRLGDRLETRNFSSDSAALAKVWDLAEQSGLLTLLEATASSERLAEWLAAAMDKLMFVKDANPQADALISDVYPSLQPFLASSPNPNTNPTLPAKNTRQSDEGTLLNRALEQNDLTLSAPSSERFELSRDGDSLALIPDANPDSKIGNEDNRSQNNGQLIAENPTEAEPLVPIDLPISPNPISQPESPGKPEPDQPAVEFTPDGQTILPVDQKFVDVELIFDLIPNLTPNPIIDPNLNPVKLPIVQPPVTTPDEPTQDAVSLDHNNWVDQPQNRDASEGDSVVEPVEIPVIPDSPAPTDDVNDVNDVNDVTDNGSGQDDSTELPAKLPIPTPLPPEEPSDWIPLANPAGNSILSIPTSGKYVIANFGGIGTGVTPSSEVVKQVDTLKFTGAGLTAQNMLLEQQGGHLVITFEDNTELTVILKNFTLENMDNLSKATGARLDGVDSLGNVLFNDQIVVEDSFDVINSKFILDQVLRANTVTFLNALDNNTQGRDNSNDVIDGLEGNDWLSGLSGQDKLRGGEGNDFLLGGAGDDILVGGTGTDTLHGGEGRDQFVLSPEGTAIIQDFQPSEDVIRLTGGLSSSQISTRIEGEDTLLVYNNQTLATLLNVKADAGLINFIDGSGNL
jgi:hypothetical protein